MTPAVGRGAAGAGPGVTVGRRVARVAGGSVDDAVTLGSGEARGDDVGLLAVERSRLPYAAGRASR